MNSTNEKAGLTGPAVSQHDDADEALCATRDRRHGNDITKVPNCQIEADLTDYEKSVARRAMIETWPLAADLQQKFVEVVKPFASIDDIILLDKWSTWRWATAPTWNSYRVIEVDVLEGVNTKRLTELFTEFETLWRKDLHIDHFVTGETYSNEPSTETKTQEWKWHTLGDAYEEKPPREYVVQGLLPLPSLTVLFGNPGDLKTMLAQDLALCVAAGKTWLEALPGHDNANPLHVDQGAALWVDCDNGLDRIERRFAALGKTHKIPADAPLAYVSFPVPPFMASDQRSLDRIIAAITATGAKLIVLDYLGALSGGADENSSEMIRVMWGLRHIAETTGTAVVVIHHRTKNSKQRLGNSLRGHSSIEGAVDLALLIEREEGSDSVTLRSTKSRDAPIQPLVAQWTYESDGRDLTAGRFYGTGTIESDADAKVTEAQDIILGVLADNPGLSQRALVQLARNQSDLGKGILTFALKQLVDEGEVDKQEGGSRGAFTYTLVS